MGTSAESTARWGAEKMVKQRNTDAWKLWPKSLVRS